MTMRVYDVSEPVSPATAVFPGDTPFSAKWVTRMEDGASCNVSAVTMSVHCGTHTDAPLHFDSAGLDMASVGLGPYLGRCRVVDVRGLGSPPLVPADVLGAEVLAGVERVLFKTRVGHDHTLFDAGFTAVGPDAACALVAAGIKLVGIDTPSMDHATCQDLAGHNVLYRGGVAILENLDLSAVPAGDYELIALPLKIVGSDSSPVRAILRELPGMTRKRPINPEELPPPQGFAHAWLVEGDSGRTLYLAGQCGHDAAGAIVAPGDLVAQLDRALANIGAVLRDAEMAFDDVVQLNFYVRSRDDYATARKEFGAVWRRRCGKHFPAMAMFEVVSLFDVDALIEIQGIAAS